MIPRKSVILHVAYTGWYSNFNRFQARPAGHQHLLRCQAPAFMEKEDARNQTLEQLREGRKQVVRLHKKRVKIMQIVAMTGLSHPTVRVVVDLYETGG